MLSWTRPIDANSQYELVSIDDADHHSKSPVSHTKKGSKYSQELAALAKRAEPDRKAALAKLEALRRRSEGGPRSSAKTGKHKIPAALLEMENLAHRKTPISSGVDGLGRLARSHGIESSKKMLAEIMSLRHYKQSNNEINDIANGFEAHSSISHRFKHHIDKDEAATHAKKEQIKKAKAAAALRLEAGRVSMVQMKHSISADVEQSIGQALEHTFKPMQHILRKDEVSLDAMVKPGLHEAESNHAADSAAHRLRSDLMSEMKSEVKRVLTEKETALEHKSSAYLAQVHAKAMQTLSSVVNPDRIRINTAAAAAAAAGSNGTLALRSTAGGPQAMSWSSKVADFLKSTQQFIRNQQDHTRPLAFNTAIQATQGELERQLKSVTLSAPPLAPKAIKPAATAKRPAAAVAALKKPMSAQQKSAFKKALDSYL